MREKIFILKDKQVNQVRSAGCHFTNQTLLTKNVEMGAAESQG